MTDRADEIAQQLHNDQALNVDEIAAALRSYALEWLERAEHIAISHSSVGDPEYFTQPELVGKVIAAAIRRLADELKGQG